MCKVTWKPGPKKDTRTILENGRVIGTIKMVIDNKNWRYWVVSTVGPSDAPDELAFHCYPTPAEAAKAMIQWTKR